MTYSRTTSRTKDRESFSQKVQRMMGNCGRATGLCCFKAAEHTKIQALELQKTQRQKKFGQDYLTLVEHDASNVDLQACLDQAMQEIGKIQNDIDRHHDKIDRKTEQVRDKIQLPPSCRTSAPAPLPSSSKPSSATTPRPKAQRPPPKQEATLPGPKAAYPEQAPSPRTNQKQSAVSRPSSHANQQKKPVRGGGRLVRDASQKVPKKAATTTKPTTLSSVAENDPYATANPTQWKLAEHKFDGSSSYVKLGKVEKVKGQSIHSAVKKFKANPIKYYAIMYQTDMLDWKDVKQQQYQLIHREGTEQWEPKGLSPSGWMTALVHEYQRLPPFPKNELPKQHRDRYTDSMTFRGKKLHGAKNKPIMPGRGMGVGDAPNLKIIGDVDPSDIYQGEVGNCWLLSGISSLAEFDGAVKRLFRKTPKLDQRPVNGANTYTVTLWDLRHWKEVDIVIDERLAASPDGSGRLLSAKPSEDAELWVCYLEKALVIHCGGWDKIVGGQCTHAWALLTGCKEQYTIRKNPKTGKWACYGKFNPYTQQWAKHANSPHDCEQATWPVPWPTVGGGGTDELDEEQLFLRMCAWDDVNYIVGAGTSGDSDKHSTEGMVDNHAYSVIESINDVAGTDIDLIKVRNPWGKGEIEDGEFDDDGPGWDRYPEIKRTLNPVVADDGIFWVTKKEFFQFFETIYLSASNMTEFLED